MKKLYSLSLLFFLLSCVSTTKDSELSLEYYNVGNAFYEIGQYEKALEYYNKVLEIDESVHKARFNLINVYIAESDFDNAIYHINFLKEADETNLKVMRLEAYVLYRFGKLKESLELYNSIIESGGETEDIKTNVAKLYHQIGDYDSALGIFNSLLATKESEELYRMAGLSAELNGDMKLAANFYESSLELSKNDEVLNSLYTIYEKLDDSNNLKRVLELLLDSDKNAKGEIYFKLGQIALIIDNDFKTGYDYLVNAADLGFDNKSDIEQLLDNPDLPIIDKIRELFITSED